MKDLNEIQIFVSVATAGSFTKAATELGLPKSTVSRRVAQLEDRMGIRLLNRTTRRLSLTDGGALYLPRCRRALEEIDEAERSISELGTEPQGILRITAPSEADWLSDVLSDFMTRHPKIKLQVTLTNRFVDLVSGGYDLAIRGGER